MRFGKTLELNRYKPWYDKYIDYTKLKKLLRDDDSAPSSPTTATPTRGDEWTDEDEGKFVDELVNVQLEKVHEFHRDTYEKLRERTAKCEGKLDAIATSGKEAEQGDNGQKSNGNGKKPMPSEAEQKKILTEVIAELDQISKETNELEKYSRINYAGFLKAAKKHDRKRGGAYRLRPLLQVRLAALPFNKEDYGPLLYRLSAMYSFARQHIDGDAKSDKASEHQENQEEYVSYKFWVHPENLLEVKTMILRRLPVLVYNPQTAKVAEGNTPDPSITSIYFDSPAFELYSNKVEKNVGSSLRLRWYGKLNNRPEIFVEKKTVGEDNTSSEARFTTKDKNVQKFINHEYHMEKQIKKLEERAGAESKEAQSMRRSVEEIQDFIKQYDLQPVLRANYTRTAFQIPGDNRVRISLDTDLAFIREDALDSDRPCRDPDTWHRRDIDNNELEYPFTSIRKGEITRFPFALLEVKIRNAQGKKSAEWIDDLMSSHLVSEAPRFSKYVHGVAQLFEDNVNTFPFWLSQMEVDIRKDPQQAFEDEKAKKQKEQDDETAVGSFIKSKSLGGSHRRKSGIISPMGSPNNNFSTSGKRASMVPSSDFTNVATANPTERNEIAEEPDDDETGTQTHNTARNPPSGLKSLFPAFSTSKYAMSRRRVQLPPGVVEPKAWIKDAGPVKVEAKVWLANQRTFIKWQHVSILLASLSLGLFNAAGKDNVVGKVLGIVYTCIALFAAAWGYGTYMWRMNLIQTRSGKDFDSVAGPVIVCVSLIAALILNFIFKYNAVMKEQEGLGAQQGFFSQSEYLSSSTF
ncbi:uncharacterized protein MYCGRDRAFT_107959 [Zymoseptoria tritici IPO323]|uniref:SPX domain-containing protein n=1 Tax=Zymoseptoria tritici (strain CBS 115943 / IPO323) TaxID=336722 RepID=F9X3H6_ZYMTI|nr:uncharacterized protein MYCGRDRAFT_107959 [Zymoseptoria tritici IPO323]EGP89830.1 hypothetical protein MYCGRDRAFT_107959 [Zymoseptoria tritici IPO323]